MKLVSRVKVKAKAKVKAVRKASKRTKFLSTADIKLLKSLYRDRIKNKMSIAQICQKLKISSPTIYYHVRSR